MDRRADGLTHRQYQLLWLVGPGMSYDQIAGVLGLRRQTVANTLSIAYRKLGVRNSREAYDKLLGTERDG